MTDLVEWKIVRSVSVKTTLKFVDFMFFSLFCDKAGIPQLGLFWLAFNITFYFSCYSNFIWDIFLLWNVEKYSEYEFIKIYLLWIHWNEYNEEAGLWFCGSPKHLINIFIHSLKSEWVSKVRNLGMYVCVFVWTIWCKSWILLGKIFCLSSHNERCA